jgi:hypothetical protein
MVGSGRSWPPTAEEWPAVPPLHRARDTVVRDQADKILQEPLKDGRARNATMEQSTEAQETAATSEEGEDIWHDLQEGRRPGGCKASSRDFHRVAEREWLDIVEDSAPSETEEETLKAQPSEKMIMVVHLDRLAPYQGTARDEWP